MGNRKRKKTDKFRFIMLKFIGIIPHFKGQKTVGSVKKYFPANESAEQPGFSAHIHRKMITFSFEW